MSVTVVSFFTPQDGYKEHAKRFVLECTDREIPHVVYPYPDQGNYLANCRQKPHVILRALEERREPILFTDIDGSVLHVPDPDPNGRADFMAVVKPVDEPRIFYVGTLYFNYTAAGLDLVRQWVEATGDWSDESSLDDVWSSGEWRGCFTPLPSTYLEILTRPRQVPRPDTVIATTLSRGSQKIAFQSSGRTRRK